MLNRQFIWPLVVLRWKIVCTCEGSLSRHLSCLSSFILLKKTLQNPRLLIIRLVCSVLLFLFITWIPHCLQITKYSATATEGLTSNMATGTHVSTVERHSATSDGSWLPLMIDACHPLCHHEGVERYIVVMLCQASIPVKRNTPRKTYIKTWS